MRRNNSSWATLIFWVLLMGLAISANPAFGQFRDVTPVQEPSITHSDDFDTAAPEPGEPTEADAGDPEFTSPRLAGAYAEDDTAADDTAADDEYPELEPVSAEEPAQRKKLSIEELEALLDGEIEEAEEADDFGLRPLKFRGITVGQSSLQDLLDLWGQPFKIVKSPSSRIIKYRANPFRQVDVTVIKDTVVSVLIHLNDVLDPSHCAAELRIANIDPTAIPHPRGNVMGMAFPERGVLFAFDSRDPEMLVSKIQLEPVNPEPFVMRAEYDFDRNYKKNLEDLDQAIEMLSLIHI